jgi:hypothetical protein
MGFVDEKGMKVKTRMKRRQKRNTQFYKGDAMTASLRIGSMDRLMVCGTCLQAVPKSYIFTFNL